MSSSGSWGGVRRALSAVAVAAMLAHLPAWSQGGSLAVVKGHEYREILDPRRPVSGHLVVGASRLADGPPLQELQRAGLVVWFYPAQPLQKGDSIRVDLDSPDGRFHGTGMWEVRSPLPAGRWQPLPLPLQENELRRPELPEGHLAVSVRVFADGKSAAPRLLAAVLTKIGKDRDKNKDMEPALRGREVWLQINARRAQMLVRGKPGESPKTCEPVASASVVRFDTLCKIDAAQMERTAEGRYRFTLLRRDGFAFQPEQVELEMQ